MRSLFRIGGLTVAGAALISVHAGNARELPLSLQDTFRIGNAGVLCTAQNAPTDKRLKGMFDRAYRLTCRDAAGAIGTLVALRGETGFAEIPSGLPIDSLQCGAEDSAVLAGIGAVSRVECESGAVNYRRYLVSRGGTTYLVEGLSGYDPALQLALATVVGGAVVPGEVSVAMTEVSDAAAFARVQAGELVSLDALDEAYNRNNSGRFAQSSEFFQTIAQRRSDDSRTVVEALSNQALQQSNLGNFAAAESLFNQAQMLLAQSDGVNQRLLRNYRAIDALNQGLTDSAIAELERPVSPVGSAFDEEGLRQGVIDLDLAEQINRENRGLQRLSSVNTSLTEEERAELLDAQAMALRGTAARLNGDLAWAQQLLLQADSRISGVRGGKVISARWIRSEITLEQAVVAELAGRPDEAILAYDRAISEIEIAYPRSPALIAASARKAGYLARAGRNDDARALYRDLVGQSGDVADSGLLLREMLQPYFRILAEEADATASAEMFLASQVLERPGVAQTQAILARALSEGDDKAAALFRLSLARSREIARTEAEVARLSGLADASAEDVENLAAAVSSLASMERDQAALLSQLADFPRYKALSPGALGVEDVQASLRSGEAYYKLMVVGDDIYGIWIDPAGSRAFAIDTTLQTLSDDVAKLRDSIVVIEAGVPLTYPYDVTTAKQLYDTFFAPVAAQLAATSHLIFEPDGPMLQLPPQVLIENGGGVAEYLARVENEAADEFDFTGINWLGRNRQVSIAVSPRGFIDIRNIAPSKAGKAYLGLGENALPEDRPVAVATSECEWNIDNWYRPIGADELVFAREQLGQGDSKLITGEAFNDTALLADDTLDEYRVLHFATHGVVTGPKPSCPPRPALLTSFGGAGSDGLLSFQEIFDLQLDADLVILSACDTAGMATAAASREAGIVTGGNYALDGLVRAFVGAGARTVVASHWPVPDDYDATKRLIAGMVESREGQALVASLGEAQRALMDQAETSHPFYWGAFIVLGDGTRSIR